MARFNPSHGKVKKQLPQHIKKRELFSRQRQPQQYAQASTSPTWQARKNGKKSAHFLGASGKIFLTPFSTKGKGMFVYTQAGMCQPVTLSTVKRRQGNASSRFNVPVTSQAGGIKNAST